MDEDVNPGKKSSEVWVCQYGSNIGHEEDRSGAGSDSEREQACWRRDKGDSMGVTSRIAGERFLSSSRHLAIPSSAKKTHGKGAMRTYFDSPDCCAEAVDQPAPTCRLTLRRAQAVWRLRPQSTRLF